MKRGLGDCRGDNDERDSQRQAVKDRRIKMKPAGILFACAALLLVIGVHAQTPPSGNQHFTKDGLSFDYPAGWVLSDQSTAQMQMIELAQGEMVLRVRAPREWLKSPEKAAKAKALMQDDYVEKFIDQLQQNGLKPVRSSVTTEIGGGPAEGTRVRAVLGRESGGMDSYYRVISDRFVNLSELGSERDMTKSAPAWDMIRNSIKVEPPPAQPTPTPKATPKP